LITSGATIPSWRKPASDSQVLEPILDPTFSSSSFGFRAGKSGFGPSGIPAVLRHRAKGIDVGGQARPINGCGHLVPSFATAPSEPRQSMSCNSLHRVAFLSWNRHPDPTAQGEQRRSSYFNIFSFFNY
jgi:hypothetical protein